jgi:hypothetical protein
LLDEPFDVRRAYIESDFFIPTEATDRIHELLEREFRRARVQRQPGLIIHGPPSSGKTSIIAEFLRKHPSIARPEDEHDDISVLSLEIDGAKINDLFAEALTALGSSFRLAKEEARKQHLYTALDAFKPRMIIIDELHTMTTGTQREREKFWAVIKKIMNRFRPTMVLVGTDKVCAAVQYDTQIQTRFTSHEIPALTNDEHLQTFLYYFEANLPLRSESGMCEDAEILSSIWRRSGQKLGECVRILQEAAVDAMRCPDEKITVELLEAAANRLERKKKEVQSK